MAAAAALPFHDCRVMSTSWIIFAAPSSTLTRAVIRAAVTTAPERHADDDDDESSCPQSPAPPPQGALPTNNRGEGERGEATPHVGGPAADDGAATTERGGGSAATQQYRTRPACRGRGGKEMETPPRERKTGRGRSTARKKNMTRRARHDKGGHDKGGQEVEAPLRVGGQDEEVALPRGGRTEGGGGRPAFVPRPGDDPLRFLGFTSSRTMSAVGRHGGDDDGGEGDTPPPGRPPRLLNGTIVSVSTTAAAPVTGDVCVEIGRLPQSVSDDKDDGDGAESEKAKSTARHPPSRSREVPLSHCMAATRLVLVLDADTVAANIPTVATEVCSWLFRRCPRGDPFSSDRSRALDVMVVSSHSSPMALIVQHRLREAVEAQWPSAPSSGCGGTIDDDSTRKEGEQDGMAAVASAINDPPLTRCRGIIRWHGTTAAAEGTGAATEEEEKAQEASADPLRGIVRAIVAEEAASLPKDNTRRTADSVGVTSVDHCDDERLRSRRSTDGTSKATAVVGDDHDGQEGGGFCATVIAAIPTLATDGCFKWCCVQITSGTARFRLKPSGLRSTVAPAEAAAAAATRVERRDHAGMGVHPLRNENVRRLARSVYCNAGSSILPVACIGAIALPAARGKKLKRWRPEDGQRSPTTPNDAPEACSAPTYPPRDDGGCDDDVVTLLEVRSGSFIWVAFHSRPARALDRLAAGTVITHHDEAATATAGVCSKQQTAAHTGDFLGFAMLSLQTGPPPSRSDESSSSVPSPRRVDVAAPKTPPFPLRVGDALFLRNPTTDRFVRATVVSPPTTTSKISSTTTPHCGDDSSGGVPAVTTTTTTTTTTTNTTFTTTVTTSVAIAFHCPLLTFGLSLGSRIASKGVVEDGSGTATGPLELGRGADILWLRSPDAGIAPVTWELAAASMPRSRCEAVLAGRRDALEAAYPRLDVVVSTAHRSSSLVPIAKSGAADAKGPPTTADAEGTSATSPTGTSATSLRAPTPVPVNTWRSGWSLLPLTAVTQVGSRWSLTDAVYLYDVPRLVARRLPPPSSTAINASAAQPHRADSDLTMSSDFSIRHQLTAALQAASSDWALGVLVDAPVVARAASVAADGAGDGSCCALLSTSTAAADTFVRVGEALGLRVPELPSSFSDSNAERGSASEEGTAASPADPEPASSTTCDARTSAAVAAAESSSSPQVAPRPSSLRDVLLPAVVELVEGAHPIFKAILAGSQRHAKVATSMRRHRPAWQELERQLRGPAPNSCGATQQSTVFFGSAPDFSWTVDDFIAAELTVPLLGSLVSPPAAKEDVAEHMVGVDAGQSSSSFSPEGLSTAAPPRTQSERRREEKAAKRGLAKPQRGVWWLRRGSSAFLPFDFLCRREVHQPTKKPTATTASTAAASSTPREKLQKEVQSLLMADAARLKAYPTLLGVLAHALTLLRSQAAHCSYVEANGRVHLPDTLLDPSTGELIGCVFSRLRHGLVHLPYPHPMPPRSAAYTIPSTARTAAATAAPTASPAAAAPLTAAKAAEAERELLAAFPRPPSHGLYPWVDYFVPPLWPAIQRLVECFIVLDQSEGLMACEASGADAPSPPHKKDMGSASTAVPQRAVNDATTCCSGSKSPLRPRRFLHLRPDFACAERLIFVTRVFKSLLDGEGRRSVMLPLLVAPVCSSRKARSDFILSITKRYQQSIAVNHHHRDEAAFPGGEKGVLLTTTTTTDESRESARSNPVVFVAAASVVVGPHDEGPIVVATQKGKSLCDPSICSFARLCAHDGGEVHRASYRWSYVDAATFGAIICWKQPFSVYTWRPTGRASARKSRTVREVFNNATDVFHTAFFQLMGSMGMMSDGAFAEQAALSMLSLCLRFAPSTPTPPRTLLSSTTAAAIATATVTAATTAAGATTAATAAAATTAAGAITAATAAAATTAAATTAATAAAATTATTAAATTAAAAAAAPTAAATTATASAAATTATAAPTAATAAAAVIATSCAPMTPRPPPESRRPRLTASLEWTFYQLFTNRIGFSSVGTSTSNLRYQWRNVVQPPKESYPSASPTGEALRYIDPDVAAIFRKWLVADLGHRVGSYPDLLQSAKAALGADDERAKQVVCGFPLKGKQTSRFVEWPVCFAVSLAQRRCIRPVLHVVFSRCCDRVRVVAATVPPDPREDLRHNVHNDSNNDGVPLRLLAVTAALHDGAASWPVPGNRSTPESASSPHYAIICRVEEFLFPVACQMC